MRVLIAVACRMVGDPDTAELEWDTARAVFERLGARPALARLDELVGRPAGHGTLPVTARELEVLRMVAAGKTNREIAEALSISERTVERHLGNIFTKLDVPTGRPPPLTPTTAASCSAMGDFPQTRRSRDGGFPRSRAPARFRTVLL